MIVVAAMVVDYVDGSILASRSRRDSYQLELSTPLLSRFLNTIKRETYLATPPGLIYKLPAYSTADQEIFPPGGNP